ncbi:threonine ammonia-lyase IlvA [Paenibacillus sp. TRM 82003]|uniref:threonine ammonia-lyase IlvA n=1 Tax=Kineococcus sp. TRM81007 TaxID=2925831 RepID=UPI001F580274|nr:threonine ammonia-lyase IlvA [Kineococcus sp. TRM81007]MCI2240147.1 threonine ammonia-lyase IlvA [Kineococcus sp. TRM81007]MCI3925546.1 threonine ammonia-lyase IlvA [Paenibacillus sp. TRM 82003]
MTLEVPHPAATTPPPDAAAVEAAARRLAGVATRTPLQPSARWSAATGARVRLKREDLQVVRSYKLRGAYNLIAQLSAGERARGVVTASAGNHAQGVAHACATLRVRGRVYVPRTTPRQKRDRIRALGGEFVETVVLGDTYDDAAAAAARDAVETGATVVPAFDDPRTLTGQGTVAVEVVEQLAELGEAPPDVLVVPVGGGGLLAGVLTWVRERHPGVRVVGVEPAGAPSMAAALAAGRPVRLEEVDSFVDGASVRRVGDVTHAVVAGAPVELVTVPEGAICVEMLAMYQTDGIIAEPAGALATAALAEAVRVEPGQSVVCVVSGGNNDLSRYAEVVERALVHEGRKHYFLVEFPQEPGALRRFLDEVLGPDDDITLFEYVKRSNRETGPALVGIEIPARDDLPALLERMAAAPPSFERISAAEPLYRYLL